VKWRWHSSPPLCPTQDFVSALRDPAQMEAIMDLRFLSRNTQTAKRFSYLQRQRGFTFTGSKIWDSAEDEIIKRTAGELIAVAKKLLAF
jgi:hypothetical protein